MNSTSMTSPPRWTEHDLLKLQEEAKDNGKSFEEVKAEIEPLIKSGQIQLTEGGQNYYDNVKDLKRSRLELGALSESQGNHFQRGRDKFGSTIDYPDDPKAIASSEVDKHHQKLLLLMNRARIEGVEPFLGQTEDEKKLGGTEKLKDNGLSRNHRLADSSIKSILVTSGYRLLQEPDSKKSDKIKNALRNFAKNMGGEEGREEMNKLLEEIDMVKKENQKENNIKPRIAFYQKVHNSISATPKNVRIGDAKKNQQADNTADLHRKGKDNRLTLKSGNMMWAVFKLASAGAISRDLATAATTPAIYKNGENAGKPVSSSEPQESAKVVTRRQQKEIERWRKQILEVPTTKANDQKQSGKKSNKRKGLFSKIFDKSNPLKVIRGKK